MRNTSINDRVCRIQCLPPFVGLWFEETSEKKDRSRPVLYILPDFSTNSFGNLLTDFVMVWLVTQSSRPEHHFSKPSFPCNLLKEEKSLLEVFVDLFFYSPDVSHDVICFSKFFPSMNGDILVSTATAREPFASASNLPSS